MNECLLEILREPDTGAELELVGATGRRGRVEQGTLRSNITGREYPIRGGIPRFVPEKSYCDSFGLQWNRYARVQLDSCNGASFSRRRFETETGWSADDVSGRWMLDAGCGSGRFAEIAAKMGARVIAMDYSTAVEAAARNLARFPCVDVVQGDIYHPPLQARSLPLAYSIGVLQHTPDPAGAVASIVRLLEPCGRFAFTIYARRWYTRLYSKYLLRPLTRRLPPKMLLRLIERTMPVLFPLTDVLFRIPMASKFLRFAIPVANYVEKQDFTRAQRYDEAVLDTFDMLSPAYDRPMTAEEVEQALRRAGVQEFTFRSRVPVNVTGAAAACVREHVP
jgi:SAM-dependent methyltransferase